VAGVVRVRRRRGGGHGRQRQRIRPGGAVFGRDVNRALAVARQIDSGICHINGPTVHDEPQMPFGGVKGSGWGRFGGKAGIDEFTELRWITLQTETPHYPF
jgi:acyl-CoA reductase-like NAD-dependent aldehyde dehydrogenase